MATLSQIETNVLARLENEAGTDDYWTTAEVDGAINFLYQDLARQYRNVKDEDTSLVSIATAGTLYDYPSGFLAIDELLYADVGLDPISIYEIKMMDDTWRDRTGDPDWYCLDYITGKILLWYFPSTADDAIKIVGPKIPSDLTANDTPKIPYADGRTLELGAISFCLAKEGPGQNLERSAYWWDMFAGTLAEFDKTRTPSMDHVLRSIDNPRNLRIGPRLPANYPRWR